MQGHVCDLDVCKPLGVGVDGCLYEHVVVGVWISGGVGVGVDKYTYVDIDCVYVNRKVWVHRQVCWEQVGM